MASGMTETEDNQQEDPVQLLERLLTLLEEVHVPKATQLPNQLAQLQERIHAALFSVHRKNRNDKTIIAVLVGPSGSGKSTLFNAIIGKSISHTSSIERPATKGAICALPSMGEVDHRNRLFPTLPRVGQVTKSNASKTGSIVLIPDVTNSTVVLVDCPDYDTRKDMNREVTRRIVPWADVILFVTSTEKYADQSAVNEFKNYGDLGVPVIAVLNRIPKNDEGLEESFEAEIAKIGIKPLVTIYIQDNDSGSLMDDANIGILKTKIAKTTVRTRKNLDPIGEALCSDIMPVVKQWTSAVASLKEDLSKAIPSALELESDLALGDLEDNEETRKFWLRYSPRVVVKGLRSFVTHPRGIFRKEPTIETPENCALDKMVKSQAWDLFESSQIRAREAMQKHQPGRMLLATLSKPSSIEFGEEEVSKRFGELANHLNEFGKKRLETARHGKTAHKSGPIGAMRLWAVDKVLRLLTLGLTLTVLPPLIWELLRIIGHPSFMNEVTQEFRLAKEEFRKIMDETIAAQDQRYGEELEAMGTSAETATALSTVAIDLYPGEGKSNS